MACILLADDEPMLRRNLGRFLVGLGHDVRTAANGNEAMSLLQEPRLDLLITDLNMPDMDGIEILNALRANGRSLPVIAISGGGQFDKSLLLDSATALGAVVTLEKPFDLDELRRAVESVLDAR